MVGYCGPGGKGHYGNGGRESNAGLGGNGALATPFRSRSAAIRHQPRLPSPEPAPAGGLYLELARPQAAPARAVRAQPHSAPAARLALQILVWGGLERRLSLRRAAAPARASLSGANRGRPRVRGVRNAGGPITPRGRAGGVSKGGFCRAHA